MSLGANVPFNLLNATASIQQHQQRALCQSFLKTRRRVGHHYLVLHCRAEPPHVTQSNHILDKQNVQPMCGTTVAAVNKLTQQENKKKTKKKKEKNTQHATGDLVKRNRAALTADECRTSQGSSFLWPREEIMVCEFFWGESETSAKRRFSREP